MWRFLNRISHLPIANYQLPITNYQLPITNYQLSFFKKENIAVTNANQLKNLLFGFPD